MSRKQESGGWWETVKTVFYAVLIAITARTFAYEPFNIPSGSMEPTLLVGDYLFVSKYAYGYSRHAFPLSLPPFQGRIMARDPKVGDIAVFKWPGDNRTDYIKRIIGLPGDTIRVVEGELFVNGKRVERVKETAPIPGESGPPRKDVYRETLPNGFTHLIQEHARSTSRDFTVPAGHLFVMGDNRDSSADSRVGLDGKGVGFLPIDNLVGRAEIVFMSVERHQPFLVVPMPTFDVPLLAPLARGGVMILNTVIEVVDFILLAPKRWSRFGMSIK